MLDSYDPDVLNTADSLYAKPNSKFVEQVLFI